MRSFHQVVSIGALALALMAGCGGSTASIEQSWRSPTATAGELTNVVTLCARRANEGVCRSAEEKLASRLSAKGVRAVPGYRVLNRDEVFDRKSAITTLRAAGFDGVVTMRFVGQVQTLQAYPTMDWYWGPDVYEETVNRIEINAYSLDDNQLVWSAIS